jgi:hypothetical protein
MIHLLALIIATTLVPVPELREVRETHGPIFAPESENEKARREYQEGQDRIRSAESARGCRYDASFRACAGERDFGSALERQLRRVIVHQALSVCPLSVTGRGGV